MLTKFFMRKQFQIQKLVLKYMDIWMDSMERFRDAWEIYQEEGASEQFFYLTDATHKEESRADDLRREIEHRMYAKALIPESRGDILGVLETVDHMLTLAEKILFDVQCQEIQFPDKLKPTLKQLAGLVYSCAEDINRAVRIVLGGTGRIRDVHSLVDAIDNAESEADHLERSLIRNVFKLDMRTGDKLMMKDIIRQLGCMCDTGERIADRLTIVSVKRRV